MFNKLKEINEKPGVFEYYTADELWTDEYTSEQMLKYHLNKDIDLSSRNEKFINRSVDWIVEKFDLNENSKVADFGCGPGLYASRLAEKNVKVTGIDFSKRSIDYGKKNAEENNLKINYINENYLEFSTEEKFDLIIMIMCDFCALSPEQRKTLLMKFSNLLNKDGSILLDVYSMKSWDAKEESVSYEKDQLFKFWSPDDYYGFVNIFKYEDEKVSLDKYTIIEEKRTRVVYNWLQYFTPESLKKEFENCGLKIAETFSDVAGTPYSDTTNEFAVFAEKE